VSPLRKRGLLILPLLLLMGCAHQDLRFGLYVDDIQEGNRLPERTTHRAVIKEVTRNVLLNASDVQWSFDGALQATDEPGRFAVKGTGPGTIRASFKAGSRTHTLSAVVRVPAPDPHRAPPAAFKPAASPLPAPSLAPVPVPIPGPAPSPVIAASPVPAPVSNPEATIYRAYDLAAKDLYLEAALALQVIRDPDWLPKANALLAEWSPKAIDQGLVRARARIEEGDTSAARALLDRLSALPRTSAQSRAMDSLRKALR